MLYVYAPCISAAAALKFSIYTERQTHRLCPEAPHEPKGMGF